MVLSDMIDDVTDRVGFWPTKQGELFACITVPRDCRGAVLMCPSLGTDLIANYRREVALSRLLAARGMATCRFHYRGTGHSNGDEAALTLGTMRTDAGAMARHVQEATGVSHISFMGARWGALVALHIARTASRGRLMWWDPLLDPADYFLAGARISRFRDILIGRAPGPSGDDILRDLAGGTPAHLFGHVFSAGLWSSFRDDTPMNAGGTRLEALQVCRLTAPDSSPDDVIPLPVQQLADSVEIATTRQTGNWWLVEGDQSIDASFLEECADWLGAGVRGKPVIQTKSLIERKPILLKRGTQRLFAVGTLPAAEADGVGVVLLPGAATPAFGNTRIWNRVAHEVARAGSVVIQLDYTGAGESGDAEVLFPLNRPLVPDVLAAVRWLRDRGCHSFILAGTCFGARSALAAGPDVPGLLGAVLLFPPVQMPLPDQAFEEALSRAIRAGVTCHFVYGERDVDHPRFVEFLAQTPAGTDEHVTVEIVPGRLHGIADAEAVSAVYASATRSISTLKDRARHVNAAAGEDAPRSETCDNVTPRNFSPSTLAGQTAPA